MTSDLLHYYFQQIGLRSANRKTADQEDITGDVYDNGGLRNSIEYCEVLECN